MLFSPTSWIGAIVALDLVRFSLQLVVVRSVNIEHAKVDRSDFGCVNVFDGTALFETFCGELRAEELADVLPIVGRGS